MEILKIIGGFVLSLIISLVSIPSIVTVAKTKKLCELPQGRHIHKGVIPTLGGGAIFGAFFIPIFIFVDDVNSQFLHAFTASSLVLFFIGIKDDILIIAPKTKLCGQILAAIIICVIGDIRITSLQGFLGIQQIPYFVSIIISIVMVVGVVNAFNLIDGIDGLAGLLAVSSSILFSIWFYFENNFTICISTACFVGAILGFLRFNLFSEKNKLFMGDTGSQLVGLYSIVLAILFIEANSNTDVNNMVLGSPIVAFAVLSVPIFDVLRVMFIRLVLKRSIFSPDNNHIHYRLLKLDFTHKQTDIILVLFNIIFAIFVWWLSDYFYINRLALIVILLLMVLFHIPQYFISRKINKLKKR
ncbi:MAG: undecaprenyl/decaprenyl-phosphate alpha-N-acetylglucosaminyl 1-phosphate transferase [Bacteroidales bacterium]|nr:undecaprenyl/decaprenyl-phosphate alpha-N-acetylglucosaminyl 1-phosphate transferase [Bacteroidales bacterium]